MDVERMKESYTANRAFALLKSFGVSQKEMVDLRKRAEAVAQSRGSPQLGFRHLVTAQNLPWSRALVELESDQSSPGIWGGGD